MSRLLRWSSAPIAALAILRASALLQPAPAGAEPYIALREGLKCSTCHVNRTGGGMRNGYGALFTQTEITPLFDEMSEAALDFTPDVGPSISLGADFLVANDSRTGVDGGDRQNTFAVDSGNLYLQVRLLPGRLSLYMDEIVAPGGATNRESFVLFEGLPGEGYLKAGRLLLPFGLRMWDDDAYVRRVTGFNYDNQDLGVEVGFEPGPWSLSMALSNGTNGTRDDNAGKQVSAIGSWWSQHGVLGGSLAWDDSPGGERLVVGPFAALSVGPVTLIGEVDRISESTAGGDNDQTVAFASADMWWRQAVNLRLAFDYHDPFDRVDEDERSRVTLGADAFLTPFLTAGAYLHLRDSVPQDSAGGADGLTLSLHAHF